MKITNPKFAATTCFFALLVTPAAVFAEHHGDDGKDKNSHKDANSTWFLSPARWL
jgi:hypothetical protein